MNRCRDKFISITDYLTNLNCIADLYSRDTGRTNMLLHREHNLLRYRHTDYLAILSVFVVGYLYATSASADGRKYTCNVFEHFYNLPLYMA